MYVPDLADADAACQVASEFRVPREDEHTGGFVLRLWTWCYALMAPGAWRVVEASGWRAWPPRLPEQPIFHPVLNRWYATKIALEWNVPHGGVGYGTDNRSGPLPRRGSQ